jgi:hypothetical protein
MVRYIGTIQGDCLPVARCGTAESGVRVQIDGIEYGIEVCSYTDMNGRDAYNVYATPGQHGTIPSKLVAVIFQHTDGKVELEAR